MRLKDTALAIAIVAATATAVLGHSGATGIVKERMDLMKDVGAQMKAVGKMIEGETAFDPVGAASAARRIADHSRGVLAMFPEGSNDPPSEALPVIWEEWADFAQLVSDMETRAGALAESAEDAKDADAIRPQFAALGKTCSACHDDFRKPD